MGKIAGLSLALLLATGVSAVVPAALPVNPQDTVRSLYDTLLSTMKDGRTLGQSGRYARLAPVVDRLFDVPSMARLAVGPSWQTLSPAQQQQVTEAFAHYISATYADRFDSYSGEQLQVTGEQPYGTEVIVQTKIVKAKAIRDPQLSDARERGFLANLRCIPRRHHQPAGDAALGIPLDPSARRRRRSDHGAEPQSRLANAKRSQGVITPHCVTQLAIH